MTEYQKSQLGLPHIFDEPMTKVYYEAAKLSDEYNRTPYDDTAKLSLLLSQLLKHVGENVRIMPNFHCEYGHNITIGNNVFINFNSIIMDNAEVIIGAGSVVTHSIPAGVIAAGNPCKVIRKIDENDRIKIR